MNWENLGQNILIWAAQFGMKILGAILLWIVGRALIGFAISLLRRALMRRPTERPSSTIWLPRSQYC